jgi:exonuclease SbcC
MVSAIDEETGTLRDCTRRLHDAELLMLTQSAALTSIRGDVESAEGELLPYLTAVSLTPESFHTDPAGATAIVLRAGNAFRKLREMSTTLERNLRELEPRLAQAEALTKSGKGQLEQLQSALTTRRGTLDAKLQERSVLLDGEVTAVHRTRINEARRGALESQTTAQNTQSAAAYALSGAVAACVQTKAAHLTAQAQADSALNEFMRACVTASREPHWVITRLAVSPDSRTAFRARLLGINQAVATAEANLATRSSDLQRALVGVDETVAAAKLAEDRSALTSQITTHQQRFGQNGAELARDLQAQHAAQVLADELEARRAQLTLWQAVDDAVGSADGARFRQFVQCITLGHLVRLANDHLSALSPRYQLFQGGTSELAVHVIDRDMAMNSVPPAVFQGANGSWFLCPWRLHSPASKDVLPSSTPSSSTRALVP